MPELPDVEVSKRYLDSTALHRKIVDVDIRAARLLDGVSAKRFRDRVLGRSLKSTSRHGKYLFARMEEGAILFHFGMTGMFRYFKDIDDDPEYDQVLFSFSDKYHLAYISRRKLGKLGIVDSGESFVEEKGLGPDALSVDLPAFRDILSDARAYLKSTLMNQSRIAGIGNIYSDEILFQAGMHPKKKSDSLSEQDSRELHRSMKRVLEMAVARKADPGKLPRTYLLPHRSKGGNCPRCGGEVRKISVSGRNGWYCPACQKND